ncbi:peptide deformylase [Neotabrizicola shimadae]|uniref:Peptide deformylase n=1 Tax=Neotabrizicola shimadae TaxID=2807096 RepID=A0A8G1EBK1_9RHOB|nr:peptide deformylase [Neotabrizicola shimadae]QYZ69715.1 peptide deformylase [Neotabrizicola shimadae]
MAILPLVTWPDERLTTPCTPAMADAATRQLAADMLETMYAAPGRGLAAPQVGHMIRLFVMDTGWKEGKPNPRVLLNPEILWRSDTLVTGPEGCLSIPGITAQVPRAAAVRLRWTDLDGQEFHEILTRFDAICAQHEADHLDGILMLDRVPPENRVGADA